MQSHSDIAIVLEVQISSRVNEVYLILLRKKKWELPTEYGNKNTYPYIIPATLHFLNVIILQVRVPVLSENKYSTYKKKKYILNLTK